MIATLDLSGFWGLLLGRKLRRLCGLGRKYWKAPLLQNLVRFQVDSFGSVLGD